MGYCVLPQQFLINKEGDVVKRYAPTDDPSVCGSRCACSKMCFIYIEQFFSVHGAEV